MISRVQPIPGVSLASSYIRNVQKGAGGCGSRELQQLRTALLAAASIMVMLSGEAPGSSVRPEAGVVPPEVHEQHGLCIIVVLVSLNLCFNTIRCLCSHGWCSLFIV